MNDILNFIKPRRGPMCMPMGGGGGGGGTTKIIEQPAPVQQYNPQDMIAAQQASTETAMRLMPETASALGRVNREQGALDLRQYITLLGQPGRIIYQQNLNNIRDQREQVQSQLDQGRDTVSYTNPRGEKVTLTKDEALKQVEKWDNQAKQYRQYDPQRTYNRAFPEIAAEQRQLLRGLEGNLKSTDQYRQLQRDLGKDYKGQRMGKGGIKAATTRAARTSAATAADTQIADIDDVRSRNIGASAAERGLMDEARGGGLLGQLESQAATDLALGRSLSAEQERDAVQAARAAAAARGMATGNSAMAAELLNRDRYASAREAERREFAAQTLNQGTGVRQAANAAYLGRMEGNRARDLQAQLANQGVAANRAMTNAQMLQQNRQFNAGQTQQARNLNAGMLQDARQFNASQRQATNVYNQEARREALAYNNQLGMTLQQANLGNQFQRANLAEEERLRQLGTQQAIIGQRYQMDPMMMLLGAPQPNNQIAGLAAQTTAGAMNQGAQGYTFDINQNNSLYNNYANNRAALEAARITGSASRDAGNAAMWGGIMQGAGAAAGGIWSDRRLKKDIKPLGKSLLGLTTYEYRYKDGDGRKRTGFMAQDVAKVLPEAVEEREYKGRTRLAIKPAVLGQAFAEALAT